MINTVLDKTYLNVLAFEKKVRSSFGPDFLALVSAKRRNEFESRMIDLIGESSNAAKLSYIRLVDEVLIEIEKAFPVRDLHVLWPNRGAITGEVEFLSKQNCNCLARIVNQASRARRPLGAFRANKF